MKVRQGKEPHTPDMVNREHKGVTKVTHAGDNYTSNNPKFEPKFDDPEMGHVTHITNHHNEAVMRHNHGSNAASEGKMNQSRGMVLGDLGRKEATMDSPVPSHAQRPNEGIRSKAEEVATEDSKIGSEFPSDGVLGRG